MEENMELTAERSLEIITEQIEKSRRAVSKDTGQWLFVTGLIAMIMSVIVASANLLSWTPLFHLLWFAFPLVLWLVMKYIIRNRVPVPESLVGTLVRKTWYTLLAFALVYSVIASLSSCWNAHNANCHYLAGCGGKHNRSDPEEELVGMVRIAVFRDIEMWFILSFICSSLVAYRVCQVESHPALRAYIPLCSCRPDAPGLDA